MNVRIRHVLGARKVLPSIIKRSLATEATSESIPSTGNGSPSPPTPEAAAPNSGIRPKIVREPVKPKILDPESLLAKTRAGYKGNNQPIKGSKGSKERSTQGPTEGIEAEESERGHHGPRSSLVESLKPSSVFASLADIYEIDGVIPQGKEVWDRLDENGVPKWGKWGLPLKVRADSGSLDIRYPHMWLRDNCRCSKCVNQDTMQRAYDTFSIPRDILPTEVVTTKEGLRVAWPMDHMSLYPWEWLMKHKRQKVRLLDENNKPMEAPKDDRIYWGAEIQANPPSVHYDEIMANDSGVGLWTEKIRKYGFCYVAGCPVSPEKTQELLERIAFIRATHYGGFYDFTADLTMKDTAYTTLALPAHTDTTYFTDPAGLQAFHLLSHEEGTGGKSLLVDGFRAARILEKQSPAAYKTLSGMPVMWHASGNEGITITPARKFPVLNTYEDPEDRQTKLMQVRWNNDDRGVVELEEGFGMNVHHWYNAASQWNKILNRPESQYWAQLEPGKPLIFDNWRVLHGRSVFTGKRRIAGAYINHDDFISRWRNTNFTREEAMKQIL